MSLDKELANLVDRKLPSAFSGTYAIGYEAAIVDARAVAATFEARTARLQAVTDAAREWAADGDIDCGCSLCLTLRELDK